MFLFAKDDSSKEKIKQDQKQSTEISISELSETILTRQELLEKMALSENNMCVNLYYYE